MNLIVNFIKKIFIEFPNPITYNRETNKYFLTDKDNTSFYTNSKRMNKTDNWIISQLDQKKRISIWRFWCSLRHNIT